ncbi:TadE/TadG family type IV pilus assembly protein [Parerythrobacter aurantius]|uniref:TadE/TadG family type IV pilus assembly protein n=1 Tax=Parerythrobacter aurantius TaxID=3127706 RepID=UPI003249E344
MSGARAFLARLRRDSRGAAIIEFAVLAPLVIGLMLGVLQVGIAMQAQNSLRSIAAETARYAVVQYQKDLTPNNAAIETQARSIATSSPFNLKNTVTVRVTDAATQRVTGALEKTMVITYTVPSVLPLFNWASPTISHTRPIFVLD